MTGRRFKAIAALLIGAMLATASGCTHHYDPNPYPIQSDRIPPFDVRGTVDVLNNQPETEAVHIGSVGAHKWMGSLRNFTETVVFSLRMELANRKVRVGADSEKTLKLAVTKVALESGMWMARGLVYLTVETGEGFQKEFIGINSTPAGQFRAWDGAIALAVIDILNDKEILNYLKK